MDHSLLSQQQRLPHAIDVPLHLLVASVVASHQTIGTNHFAVHLAVQVQGLLHGGMTWQTKQ